VEFVYRVLATAAAVWLSTFLVPGIALGPEATVTTRIGTLIGIALLFGLVNLILKPVVKVVGCLLYILTLGLFGLVVNGLLLWLTAVIAERLGLPFKVAGFWAGFWGAIVIAIGSFILTLPLHVRHITRHAQRNHP
jgi:putative membrane protein